MLNPLLAIYYIQPVHEILADIERQVPSDKAGSLEL